MRGNMNRYAQIQPAKFTPFSMEQMLFPAMTMRQQHDEAMNKLVEMESMDSMRLPTDDPLISKFYDDFRTNLETSAQQLASDGFSSPVKDKLTNLHREYSRFTSPSEVGGKAQQNYMEAMEGWKATRDQLVKQNASPAYIKEAQKDYLTGNYQGVRNEDGTYNEFTPGRVANFYDVPTEVMNLFKEVGSTEDLTGIENHEFKWAPNGQLYLIDRNTGTRTTNTTQLEAAANALMQQYTNPDLDRGLSAMKQQYTPESLTSMLNDMKDAYYKQNVQRAGESYQQFAAGTPNGREPSEDGFVNMFGTPQVEAANIPAGSGRRELTGLMGRGEQPYSLATHSISSNYNDPNNKVHEGPYTLSGPFYVTATPGSKLSSTSPAFATRKGSNMPVEAGAGMLLADVKEVGYVTLYEIDDVEIPTGQSIPMPDPNAPKPLGSHVSGGSRSAANKAIQEAERIKKLSRNYEGNTSGGALVGVGDPNKDSKNASLYGLPANAKPQIDDQGRYYFIHGDAGGQVKVFVRPKFLKEVIGREPGVKKDEAKADDYVRAFVPATRQEAIRELGAGSGVEAPIGVTYSSGDNGNYYVQVLQNQPILDENRIRNMASDAMNFLHQLEVIEGGQITDPMIARSLRGVNVDPTTLLEDFEIITKYSFEDIDSGLKANLLEHLLIGIQKSAKFEGDRGATPAQRLGSGRIALRPRDKQALDNFLNFLFAYEVTEVYTPNKKQ